MKTQNFSSDGNYMLSREIEKFITATNCKVVGFSMTCSGIGLNKTFYAILIYE